MSEFVVPTALGQHIEYRRSHSEGKCTQIDEAATHTSFADLTGLRPDELADRLEQINTRGKIEVIWIGEYPGSHGVPFAALDSAVHSVRRRSASSRGV